MEMFQISSSEMETVGVGSLVGVAVFYMIAGFCAIQTTGLSNSVSPLVMSLFKYCFFVFTFYSISRGCLVTSPAFFAVSRQVVEPAARKHLVEESAVKFFHLVLFLFTCSSLAIRHFFPTGVYVFVIPLPVFLYYQRVFRSHWMKLLRRVLDSSSLDPFTTWLQVYISAGHEKTNFPLPSSSTNAAATGQERNSEKIVKTIKFAVGMTGSILFQNYFKLNSFEETFAFIYLAVAWLASITLLSLSNDLGVFNFILGNVMVGSTVAEAGLGAHTWLAFAASLLLFCLHLELKSLPYLRERLYIRVHIVTFILFIIFYYGAYLVLFVYRTYILSESRPLFDR